MKETRLRPLPSLVSIVTLLLLILAGSPVLAQSASPPIRMQSVLTAPSAPEAPDIVVRYVDKSATGNNSGTSWANAYTNLAIALFFSDYGTHLWIAEGTYTPSNSNRNQSFNLKDGVSLYGGFPAGGGDGTFAARFPAGHPTILSGEIGGAGTVDNSYHVLKGDELIGKEIVVDGVTIAYGNANGAAPDNVGAGVYLDRSVVTLRNCVIRDNTASGGPPAIFAKANTTLKIDGCRIESNSSGGEGSAIFADSFSSVTVEKSLIQNNHATFGIGPVRFVNSTSTVRNTVLLNNTNANPSSGAITIQGGQSTISHITVSGHNQPAVAAINVGSTGSNVTLNNSILWGNGSSELLATPQSTLNVDSSIVQGGYPGGTNISSDDPLFESSSDLRLGFSSPAKDSANPSTCAEEDIQGYPRPSNNGCDMGAYEMFFQSSICATPGATIPDNDSAGKDFSMPFNDTGRILDVDFSFQATHPYVGDLVASLTLQGSGLTQDLLKRPRNDSGGFCNGDNVNVTLDDQASTPVGSLCASSPPAVGGKAVPSGPLALFNDVLLSGPTTWTLNISDNALDDVGTLNQWCVFITTQPSKVVTRLDDPVPSGCQVGDCSLREAILDANQNSRQDTIIFAVDGTFTLSQPGRDEDDGLTGDLDITQPLTIIGNGADKTIIDGGGIDRVFHIIGASDVLLSDLTIQNGLMDPGTGLDGGGGLLRNMDGRTHLLRTIVRNNRAQASAGGSGVGGGVSSGFGGSLILEDSAVYGNSADFYGGMDNIDSQMEIRNSSIYSNSGAAQTIFNVATGANASLLVSSSTVAGNDGGFAIYTGANTSGLVATTTLQNSIIQAPSDHCAVGTSDGATATITSLGHNIAGDDTCNLTATGDQPNTDARLAPAADNGSAIPTLALVAGSPALDAGDDAACPVNDQRGLPRLDKDGNGDGGADLNPCDIGAYEAQSQPTVSLGFTSSTATVDEGAGAITLTIGLEAPVTKLIYLLYAVYTDTASADDFGWFTGAQTVTIPADQTSATISIPITEDTQDEPDEQFQVRITAWYADNTLPLVQGQMTTTVTIQDNDEPNAAPVANETLVNVNGPNAPVILTGSDDDQDPLTYTVLTQPAHGTLSGTAPNLRYTPTVGFTGTDSFTFKVNDGKVDSAPATVTLRVNIRYVYLPLLVR